MPKRSKPRLAALMARSVNQGAAYVPKSREVPDLGSNREQASTAYASMFGVNRQALTTAAGTIPLADEEELEKVRRRRTARRTGGRASTVLSEENRLGG